MRNLKTMYVIHSLGTGGAEKLVYDTALFLKGSGIEAVVCCLDYSGAQGEKLKKQGFKVFDLKRRMGIDLSIIKKLRAIVREEKPDILHAHQYTPYFYTMLSLPMFSRPKSVFTEHGRFYPDRIRPKRVIFNQIANIFTDAIVGVCEFTKEALVKYEMFPRDKIRVIYNGVKPDEFQLEADIASKKKSLGLSFENKVIGTIGRLCREKNYEMLIQAFAEVRKTSKDVKLLIVGDGELRGELEFFTKQLQLDNDIFFLGERQDIPELMQIFDIFTLSSDLEGASLVLLEAMASGLSVVATDVGGNPELVVDGKTGILVPPGDYKKFADAITHHLQNKKLQKEMGEAGRQRVGEKFTFKRMADEYVELYQELISKK